MKKLLLYVIVLSAAAALFNCSKPKSGTEALPPEISFKQPRPYPVEGGDYTIAYTIKNPREGVTLEVSSKDKWIKELTSDEKSITFSLTANKNDKSRSGNIELYYEGAEPENITVRQKGTSENTPEITASEPEDFDYTGGHGSITYSIDNPVEDAELKASTEDSWITDIAVTAEEVTFTVGINASDNSRTGQIKLEYEDAKPLDISIRQSGNEYSGQDLSCDGTANCYIVSEPGDYIFPAVKGNSNQSVGTVSSVEVLWETFGTDIAPAKGDLISEVSFESNIIAFRTNTDFRKGNAVIAAKDASGKILWSWHIWLTDQPEDQIYNHDAGIMMDRNLGATSATPGDIGALGLFYQWGRKDPFPGASSNSKKTLAKSTLEPWPDPVYSSESTGTIDYTVNNPTVYISSTSDWLETVDETAKMRWNSEKTIYDPCPPGYRIPEGGDNGIWATAFGSSDNFKDSAYDSSNKGFNFGSSGKCANTLSESASVCWYPTAEYLFKGSLIYAGSNGHYWSCSYHPTEQKAYFFNFLIIGGFIYPSNTEICANGCSVRCQRE